MKINIITLFPLAFPGILDIGLIGKALRSKIFEINVIDLKKFSINGRVDDRPFGGGPGMIIKPEIIEKCFIENNLENKNIIFASPRGQVFNQNLAEKFSKLKEITFLCGRYEGIDQRLFNKFDITEVSLGDFILCGGEVAVLAMVESIVRLLPKVLHNSASVFEESFSNFLLEHDHYTRPVIWNNLFPPEILFTGHHKEINKWKLNNSIENTKKQRPDLFYKYLFMIFIKNFIKLIQKT